MKKFFQKLIKPFRCQSCGDDAEQCNHSKAKPTFCIGHVGMALAVLYIVIMQLTH